MPAKYYLHGLTENEKHDSYVQEMFGDFSEIKIRICCLVIGVSILDWFLGHTVKSFFSTLLSYRNLLSLSLPSLCTSSHIYPFSKGFWGSKLFKALIISNSIAGTLFSIYVLLIEMRYLEDALKSNQQEQWIIAHSSLFSSIYIILIINLLSPVWYLKLMLPGCYYLGGLIAYMKVSHPLTPWVAIRNTISFIYVVIINSMISKSAWQQFERRLSIDTWNQVYQYILDRNPSSIVILDEKGKVVYSNTEFNRNAAYAEDNLFSKITNLRMRNLGFSPSASSRAGMASVSFNNEETKNLLNILNLQNISMKSCSEGIENNNLMAFDNLDELLSYYLKFLDEKKPENPDQIIFDGKMTLKGIIDVELSYEIIIRPLLEYKK